MVPMRDTETKEAKSAVDSCRKKKKNFFAARFIRVSIERLFLYLSFTLDFVIIVAYALFPFFLPRKIISYTRASYTRICRNFPTV